ncbi:M60 family metallopeptidase [Lysinibacillus sp. NPDC097287]|uniref:M60 family metallopeptidase n=1 Tax=Lysinibacillus sp. NPDC097287 TaxID=3364144 RepID=UPI0037FAB2BF
MKKTISSVAAFSILATSVPVYASPVEAKPNKDASILVGNLEVDVNFALPIMNTTEELTGMTLSLTDAQGKKHDVTLGKKTSTLQIDGKTINYEIKKLDKTKAELDPNAEKVYYYSVMFKELPVGKYSLSLSGEGFKTTDELAVNLKDYSQRVTLSNKDNFLMGDFDKDGQVTQKDYDALIDNIKATDASTIKKFDLNRDGAVSILDLSYIQESLNKTSTGALIVETSPIVDTNKMKLDAASSVGIPTDKLDTAIENLMTGKESVGVEVTPDQPAQIGMAFDEPVKMDRIDIAVPNSDAAPSAGYVLIEDEHGKESKAYYGTEAYRNAVGYSAKMNRSAGNIQIDLKGQVAVKKITIVVTETTSKDAQLAEIGKVEFLNNVYEEIPAPEMNIPEITEIVEASEELTVKWNAEPNVDGYEVKLVGKIKNKETTKILQTNKTQVKFEGLDNYEPYKISIQSMNGEWTSGYSKEMEATPKPTGKPEAPEGVSIKGIYKGLEVNWSKHKNADTFNLYYKKSGSDEEPKAVENLKQLNYTITDLEDDTEYEIYLTAVNEHGVSSKSQIYKGKTIDLKAPITPDYKLINVSKGVNQPTEHIKGVTYPAEAVKDDEFAIVDNDYSSSWIYKSWDGGGFNQGKPSPVVEFDSAQTLDTIVVTPDVSQKYEYGYVKVRVQENGQMVEKPAYFNTKRDKNGKVYYEVRLNGPVTTDKVQVNFALGMAYGDGTISISEMKFYHYDSLERDVRSLFEDDLLVKLNTTVTLDTINELRERANTVDAVSGEYHPYREAVLRELDYAEQLYTDSQVDSEIMVVNQGITNTGNNIGMSNDNQALGLSARAGDDLTVYVGSNGTLPELVFTQVYGESGKYQKTVKLKKGRNVIQVPKIHDMDVEKGGNIYVRYPSGSPTKGDIKVRVMGATKIPHLNLYGKINDESKQDEVKAEIRKYITDLQAYVDKLPSMYPTEENTSENKYLYDKKTSVMNTTDIELDKATFNVSATAVWEGLEGSASMDAKVDQLYDSLKAMEQMMDLKYAERGVSKNPDFDNNGKVEGDELKHAYPKSRANIKYQRMFIGAFMYASGNHVGIEYDSVPGLTTGKPFTFNADGTVKDSGDLFGWGIAHEIGHMTDMPTIGTAEVTNNIIALLAQTFDDRTPSRLEDSGKYEKIYEKVTSGTISLPADVFAQLGMYWQLHLAYDKNPTALMLQTDTDSDPTNDSIFAKISQRVRTLTAEESALPKEQVLVRVASDAAGKDLSDFFYAWGIRPDDATKKYLSDKGYEKESRSIQYLNDDARRKVLNDKVGAIADDTEVTVSLDQKVPEDSVIENKDITLNLGVNKESDKILGYEIYRNGKVIGFTTEDTFKDSLGALNNRVVEYSVKAIDYHLNETDVKKLDPIKISHDGTMDKQGWSVETNMTSDEDVTDENNNHGAFLDPSVNKVIDNDNDSVFTGTKPKNADGHVIIGMDAKQPIVGFRYKKPAENAIKGYDVYVSTDKENWTLANSGTFDASKDEETIYFNKEGSDGGKQLWSYDASYVKIVAKGAQTVAIPELDIIAPPGDNIEIGTREALYKDGIGTLKSDFVYDRENNQKIPKGSLIITGSYRGHPAFNASLLRDQNGDIMSSETIFMAELPNNAELGEISEGTYITWITPEQLEKLPKLPSKVMTEMYRVNDAITLEGQRLVSDTLYIDVPTDLPEIEFTDSSTRSFMKKSTITHGVQGLDIYKDFKEIK